MRKREAIEPRYNLSVVWDSHLPIMVINKE